MKKMIYSMVFFMLVFFIVSLPLYAQKTEEATPPAEETAPPAEEATPPAEEVTPPAEEIEQLPQEAPAETQVSIPVESQVTPQETEAEETVWIEDSLPADATITGGWKWDTQTKFSGTSSHTNEIKEGIQEHSFKSQTPLNLPTNSAVVQYVYLDPQALPKGIMLKFYLANGEELGTYWEGEEEVFTGVANYETTWYMDVLPQPGKWVRLEVLAEELGIEDESLVGISFLTADGKAYWDKTSIVAGKSVVEEMQEEEMPAVP